MDMSVRATEFRGGATIGWIKIHWPLAKLQIEPGRLTVRALSTYVFEPGDVVSLEQEGHSPWRQGLRIRHNRQDYPERIVFNALGDRIPILKALAGFATLGRPIERSAGFAVKWSVLLGAIALWCLMVYATAPVSDEAGSVFTPWSILPVAVLFAFSTAAAHSPTVQKAMLRPGRHASEIKDYLVLMQLVSGLLLAISALFHLIPA